MKQFELESFLEHYFKKHEYPKCFVCNESKNSSAYALKCGHAVCFNCVMEACPMCNKFSINYDEISINQGHCAGACFNTLADLDKFYISSCGHVFCKDCFGLCNIGGTTSNEKALNFFSLFYFL